jgi:hypothetical protein
MICGCYRRDEAQNPEQFAAALALVLGDYDCAVVDYAADPRTGVAAEFPMGLPNVGQVRELCDRVARRQAILALPNAKPKPFVPPPVRDGEITYDQFLEMAKDNKTKARPVGRFETISDKWNRKGADL